MLNPVRLYGRSWAGSRFEGILSRIILQVGVTLLYVATGKMSVALLPSQATFAPIWWPTGVALGAVLLFGRQVLPAIFVGAFILLFSGSGGNLTYAVFGAVGDVIEAWVGGYLVQRYVPGGKPLTSAKNLFRFFLYGAMLAPALSSTLGLLGGCLSGQYPWSGYAYNWLTWWLENMTGVLVVGTLALAWGFAPLQKPTRQRTVEALGIVLGLCLVGDFVFGAWLPITKDYPLEFLCTPFLVVAAFRLGDRGVTTSLALLSILSAYGTARGLGPFVRINPVESIHLLQTYLGTNALLTLTISAVLSERQEMATRLARSNVELERFAYLASHDLQEPLRTVSSFCRLIQRRYKGQSDAQTDEYLTLVVDAAQRMHTLINSLLDYSRLGKRMSISNVDCNQLMQQTVDNLKASVTGAEARVNWVKLPSVKGDATLISTLFQNLVVNSLKFRTDARPEIEVSCRQTKDDWEFSFQDNGLGIEPEYHARIFQLFQRAVPDGGAYPGTGMGLAVCKKIVEEHGGKMWVESRVGHGARFIFTLPQGFRAIS